MSHLVRTPIVDRNGKPTTVLINPQASAQNSFDRTKRLGAAPSVAELRGGIEAEVLNTFIPTRFPYTYGIDFVRGNIDVVPQDVQEEYSTERDETIDSITGSRGATSGLVRKWAEMKNIDPDDLFNSLANAYLEQYSELKATPYLESPFEITNVTPGYPSQDLEQDPKHYEGDDGDDHALYDLARYHQQFGLDGHLFEHQGKAYVDHNNLPDGVSNSYGKLYAQCFRLLSE